MAHRMQQQSGGIQNREFSNMSPNYAKYERRQKYLNWTITAYKVFLAVGVVVSIAWLIWGK